MLVWATRTLPEAVVRGLILAALFVVVVVLEIALSSALTTLGIGANLAFGLAGFLVLGTVLALNWRIRQARALRAAARETARKRQGLPEGPCCLIWRGPDEPSPLPWMLKRPIRPRYPALARRLGIEGAAVVAFEIGSDGRAKSVRAVEHWPAEVFFRAAAAAVKAARFRPPQGRNAALSATYQLPFVFRISGRKLQPRSERPEGAAQGSPVASLDVLTPPPPVTAEPAKARVC